MRVIDKVYYYNIIVYKYPEELNHVLEFKEMEVTGGNGDIITAWDGKRKIDIAKKKGVGVDRRRLGLPKIGWVIGGWTEQLHFRVYSRKPKTANNIIDYINLYRQLNKIDFFPNVEYREVINQFFHNQLKEAA